MHSFIHTGKELKCCLCVLSFVLLCLAVFLLPFVYFFVSYTPLPSSPPPYLTPYPIAATLSSAPHSNSGGGGERVLWLAVQKVQQVRPKARICIYTGDSVKGQDILDHACSRFNLPAFAPGVEFVRVVTRRAVEASLYPRLTLIGRPFIFIFLLILFLSLSPLFIHLCKQ